MKIIVFGSTGLLGRYVTKYFEKKNYDILAISRETHGDFSKYSSLEIKIILTHIIQNTKEPVFLINCIGITNKTENTVGQNMEHQLLEMREFELKYGF